MSDNFNAMLTYGLFLFYDIFSSCLLVIWSSFLASLLIWMPAIIH
jgi:hypothetical protein